MQRGRLVLGAVVILVAAIVGAAWVVPGLLDWNRYRAGIATLASQQLGRPVQIAGAVSLQLLPQPILTASDLTVEPGANPGPTLAVKALRLRVGLSSLLAGRLDARELTLQGADLRLPWPPQQGSFARRPPEWLTELQARVEDSRLQVGELVLTGIDATLTTDPDTGTLAAAGTGHSGPRAWRFTARLTRPGNDGSSGLDVSLDGLEHLQDTGGTFSGQLGANGALAGRVAGRGPDLSLLMPAPSVPWRGDGRLTASGGLAVADQLALEIGGAPARGTVALRIQPTTRLDVAVTAGRLDLDAWLPALLGRKPGTLRAGIPTGIDLAAEAATLGGGTIRQLRAGLDLGAGPALRLRDVHALLPGDAAVTLQGAVASGRFDGTGTLRAPDLRQTLRWADRAIPGLTAALPQAALQTADLSAHLVLGPDQLALSGLQGRVDGVAIAGDIGLRQGPRWSASGTLSLDRLTLDPWLSPPLLARLSTAGGAAAALATLRQADLDLKLQAQSAQWSQLPLGPVALEFQTDAKSISLRRLEARPLGVALSLSGQVGENDRVADARLEATAPDLAALRAAIAATPAYAAWAPLLLGSGHLLATASGPPDALAAQLLLDVGDLRIDAQPTISLPARRWSGPLALHHPGAPRLLDAFGLRHAATWLGDGSLSLVGQITATPGRIAIDSGRISAGSLRGEGQGWAEGHRISGRIAFETLPLPAVSPRSTDPLPLDWLPAWQAELRLQAAQLLVGLTPALTDLDTTATLSGGVLTLDKLSAHAAGGTLSGTVVIDASKEPPTAALRGQATSLGIAGSVFHTPLDIASGQADLGIDLQAAGYSPAALLSTLSGHALLKLSDGVATGVDLAGLTAALALPDPPAALAAARQALLAGDTPFRSLEAPLTIQRGGIAIDAHLGGTAGTLALSGTLDPQSGTEDLRLQAQPLLPGNADAPALGLRLTGPFAAPGRTPELSGLARWLADRPLP